MVSRKVSAGKPIKEGRQVSRIGIIRKGDNRYIIRSREPGFTSVKMTVFYEKGSKKPSYVRFIGGQGKISHDVLVDLGGNVEHDVLHTRNDAERVKSSEEFLKHIQSILSQTRGEIALPEEVHDLIKKHADLISIQSMHDILARAPDSRRLMEHTRDGTIKIVLKDGKGVILFRGNSTMDSFAAGIEGGKLKFLVNPGSKEGALDILKKVTSEHNIRIKLD